MATSLLYKVQDFRRSATASKLATTLKVTGGLIDGAKATFGAPPFVGLICGACKMGGKMLSPPPLELSDLENQSRELQESLETSNKII